MRPWPGVEWVGMGEGWGWGLRSSPTHLVFVQGQSVRAQDIPRLGFSTSQVLLASYRASTERWSSQVLLSSGPHILGDNQPWGQL